MEATPKRTAVPLLAFAAVTLFAHPAHATDRSLALAIIGSLVVGFFVATAGLAAVLWALLRLPSRRRGLPGGSYWVTWLGCIVGGIVAAFVVNEIWPDATFPHYGLLVLFTGVPGGLAGYWLTDSASRYRWIWVAVGVTVLAAAAGGAWVVSAQPMDREIRRFGGPNASFGAVAVHPDGKSLASVGSGGSVYVWDLDSGALIVQLESSGLPDGSKWVGFSSDGTTLFTIDDWVMDGAVDDPDAGPATAWSVGEWTTRTLPAYVAAKAALHADTKPVLVDAVALSVDDLRAVYVHRTSLVVLELVGNTVLHTLSLPDDALYYDHADLGDSPDYGAEARGALSADGTVLAAAFLSPDRIVQLIVWHLPSVVSTGPRTFDLGVEAGAIFVGPELAVSADGSRVVVAANGVVDDVVRVLDVDTGELRTTPIRERSVMWVVLGTNSETIAMSYARPGTSKSAARVYHLASGEVVAELERGDAAAFTPNGTRLITSYWGDNSLVVLWDLMPMP